MVLRKIANCNYFSIQPLGARVPFVNYGHSLPIYSITLMTSLFPLATLRIAVFPHCFPTLIPHPSVVEDKQLTVVANFVVFFSLPKLTIVLRRLLNTCPDFPQHKFGTDACTNVPTYTWYATKTGVFKICLGDLLVSWIQMYGVSLKWMEHRPKQNPIHWVGYRAPKRSSS